MFSDESRHTLQQNIMETYETKLQEIKEQARLGKSKLDRGGNGTSAVETAL